MTARDRLRVRDRGFLGLLQGFSVFVRFVVRLGLEFRVYGLVLGLGLA